MSKRSRESPRRSNLTLPGSNERFLAKAPSIDADAFILDLEDAVAPGEKVGARAKICAAVLENDFGGRPVTVRINGWTTEWARDDVATVVAGCKGRLDAVMVPKASGPEEIRAVSALIDEIERIEGITLGTTGIDILVESAVGLASVEATVLASPRIESLSVGLGDLAATLGMPVLVAGEPVAGYPGDIYHYALFRLLVAGRAAEIAVIDGAYQRVEDLETLEQIARRTRALGFDGKWAIHPSQVGVLNGIYAPSPEEIARAQAVISALDAAIESDQAGAIRDADEMIDEASRTMAIAVLARAARSMPIQGRP